MKKENLIRIVIALVVAASSGAAFSAVSGDAGTSRQMQSAMPGPAHKQLAKRAGEYTTVTKFTVKEPSRYRVYFREEGRFEKRGQLLWRAKR